MDGVLDGPVVVLRFEDQIMGSGLFCKYLISWVEIQQVQCTLTNCEKNLNLISIHFQKKICWQQKIRCCSAPYHLSLWLDSNQMHPHIVFNHLSFLGTVFFVALNLVWGQRKVRRNFMCISV
jgi:hypothetical protein